MPTTIPRALAFLLGLWLALTLLGPLAPAARGAPPGPDLAELEAGLHRDVNAVRLQHHREPLQRDPRLDQAARRHSADMARRRYLSHETPEGHTPVDRVRAAGAEDFRLLGENVGLTSRSRPNEEIVRGWLASPVHRENLLAPAFNATGVGVARAADGTLYYTQLYAR